MKDVVFYKTGISLRVRSHLEESFIFLCDIDPAVVKIDTPTFKIKYMYGGKVRSFRPGFLVEFRDGRIATVVCQWSQKNEEEESQVKYAAVEKVCKNNNYLWMLVDETIKQGFMLKNSIFLRRYALREVSSQFQQEALSQTRQAGRLRLKQVAKLAGDGGPEDVMNVYNLLYHGYLLADLVNEELSLQSWVWAPNSNFEPVESEVNDAK